LECLWAQVEKLKLDGWVEKHINRPYLAFDSVLCEALQHNLPQIALPPHHEGMRYPIPSVVYRMFDYTDCPEVRGGLKTRFEIHRKKEIDCLKNGFRVHMLLSFLALIQSNDS
jgi:hypothetical protein